MLSTVLISRIQFAFTVSFHIIFPAFSIGLATFLAIVETMWLVTKKPEYLQICRFWTKVFALTFGMGVVSGIVMEFQFGTNWAGFTNAVGGVLGALFTYEVLTAFFIEAGFLGVMIFGWERVGPKLHYLSTLLVVLGVTLSAFWILSANSWMQTPAGVKFVDGHFIVTNWYKVIFNPSVIPRYIHMMLAAYVTTAFVIASVSAYYLLKTKHQQFANQCFKFSIVAGFILIMAQLYVGDVVGREVHRYQPIKTAAMEAVWKTQRGAPLLLFGIPSMKQKKNLFAIEIPHLAALLNTHQWNGKLVGLDSVPAKDRPFVPFVFYAFRIMVGLGLLMFLITLTGVILLIRKRLLTSRWFQHICVWSAPLGFIALWCGWITAETGRQPWVVYNYLRTDMMASRVTPLHVLIVFILIVLVYGIIFGVFYFKYLSKLLRHGPIAGKPVAKEQPFTYMAGQPLEKEE